MGLIDIWSKFIDREYQQDIGQYLTDLKQLDGSAAGQIRYYQGF